MKGQYGNELAALAQMAREETPVMVAGDLEAKYAKERQKVKVMLKISLRRGKQIDKLVTLANWIIDNESLTVDEIKTQSKMTMDEVMGIK